MADESKSLLANAPKLWNRRAATAVLVALSLLGCAAAVAREAARHSKRGRIYAAATTR